MAKTNFSKVENALSTVFEKMRVDLLRNMADVAQKAARPELRNMMEKALKAAVKTSIERKGIFFVIRQAIGMRNLPPEFYEKIGASRQELVAFLGRGKELTPAEWATLKNVKQKILEYKKQLIENHMATSNDQLVQQERKRHTNKRFNVKEKWLPLE